MWPFNSKENVTHTKSGLRIEDKPSDRPKFERVYSADLTNGRTIKVTMRTTFGGRRYSFGELNQPGGRWVIFEPERVADKILDPALVPLVQSKVDEILEIDRRFVASDPSEFVDEGGVQWRRIAGS